MKVLNSIIFRFLWNSDVDKVKRKIFTQKYSKGGLIMLDLENYIKGLKFTWIRRILLNNNSKSVHFINKEITNPFFNAFYFQLNNVAYINL